MTSSERPNWTASWLATLLVIAQIVLVVALGGGDIRWLRYIGFGLWALSAVFGWLPIYQFKKRGGVTPGDSYIETTKLVDTGLYAIVRHPQYVAWPLMAIAVSLVSQHWLVIVMGMAVILLSSFDFRKVDAMDTEKFGDEYREYMDRVPGWNFVAGTWRWLRKKSRANRTPQNAGR